MADAKKIDIRVATTGAGQAAADLNKIGAAQETIHTATGAATKSLEGFSQAGQKVTMSSGTSRFAMQNMAFQFQDLAVQAEMGTNAVRIFSQQVPQMLGGFDPVGAIAGAVVGIAVPLGAALFNVGKAAGEAAPKVESLKEALEDHAEAVKKDPAAKLNSDNKAWLESLSEEEGYYDRIVNRLERQFVWQAKLRAIKTGAADSKREAQIAEIEADPNKSEPDKIAAVAAIRKQDILEKAQSQKDDLVRDAEEAKQLSDAAQAKADRLTADAAAAKQKLEEKKAVAASLEKKSIGSITEGRTVPAREKALAKANMELDLKTYAHTGLPSKENMYLVENKKQRGQELYNAKEAAKRAASEIEAAKAAKAELPTFDAGATKAEDDAKAARESSSSAYLKRREKETIAESALPVIDEKTKTDLQSADARTRAAHRQATERKARDDEAEKKRQDAKDKAEKREALQEELESSKSALNSKARTAGLNVRKAGLKSGNATQKDIGKALEDGTNEAEITKLGDQVREAASKNGAAMTSALLRMLGGFEEQSRKIAQIEDRLKNLRNPSTR